MLFNFLKEQRIYILHVLCSHIPQESNYLGVASTMQYELDKKRHKRHKSTLDYFSSHML